MLYLLTWVLPIFHRWTHSKAFRLIVTEGRCGPRRCPFSNNWQKSDQEKAHPASVGTMRKGRGMASSPNRLPPFSLLDRTASSWNWSQVPSLDLPEMIAFLLDDGGRDFFSRLL